MNFALKSGLEEQGSPARQGSAADGGQAASPYLKPIFHDLGRANPPGEPRGG